ncbi:MAG TPA: hypothetical protein VN780_11645 [Candidatus Eisenbacteria bacterium]|jgi:hypothetical protein|nr:hypothetical protein [Candidatus Eisenbacteria bacterium]
MIAQDYKAPESIGRLQRGAVLVGLVGLVLCIFGWIKSPDALIHSYLLAFLFVLGLSLGSLGLLMLQHLTGGHWGIVIRRPLESATRSLPLVFVLFLPIFFGMKYLYAAWLTAPKSGEGALSEFQQSYLTSDGFKFRALIYFAIWLILMFVFNRWSREQDVNREDRSLRRRLKLVAGPGIILYVFAMSFAAIDWVMSISPHWASTIYGFLFIAGQLISSMSLMISIAVLLAQSEPLREVIQKRHLHDLGKLLLAFVMLWAYFDFSQLLITWSGNLPEEISFYRSRLYGQWGVVAVVVLIFHFFVPFFLLLSRSLKRNPSALPKVALWLILMRLVDLYWMTRPEFTSSAIPSIWDLAAPLALGGLWFGVFAWQLQQRPLLPLGDPKLEEAIERHEY